MNNEIKKEFLQKYKLDNYSRAVPASKHQGKTALLAEYCEPIDSQTFHGGALKESDGYSSDPEKRYAQPQDAIDVQKVKQTKIRANQSDDDELYQLAQQPAEEYGATPHRKPSPKPRSARHTQLQQQNSAPLRANGSTEACSTELIKDNSAVMSPDLSAEVQVKKKRPGKKVVEIEYEVASEIRLSKAGDPSSVKSNHEQGPIKSGVNPSKQVQPSPHTSPSSITSAFVAPQQSQYTHSASISKAQAPSIDNEVAYEEPWDLKMKRLKLEQEKKAAKRLAKRTDKLPGIPKTGTYEHAWESAAQPLKPEEKNYARSLSQTSEAEVFHDALDSFSDQKSEVVSVESTDPDKNTSGKLKPLPQNTYEDAWDLKNSLLEMKIREMQLQASAIYEEPWDSSKQQKQLKAKHCVSSSVPVGNSEADKIVKPRSDTQEPPREESESVAPSTRKHHNHGETSAKSRGHGCNIGQRINPMIPLACQNWYHGNISREDSEKMLCVCKEGSYIVRISSDRRSYSLSIKSVRQYIHVQIDQKTNEDGSICYILGKNSKEFNTIPEMIDYYTHHRVPLKGAEHITLLHPVECKWS
ncbi:unnamed protein product [Candidula unifasciata]|uniref:SH2 domain-containing protein n=1 Tax=Candidula unifasciata TaxID=100452 RepID=A0A8S3ZSV9_9EUPU|nr:unnamed protein product [Candidula unifasciata]